MLRVEIPGREAMCLEHLVLDYNGTIARDGELIEGVKPRLEALAEKLEIFVITADTHGTAAENCRDIPVKVLTFPTVRVGEIKAAETKKLPGQAVCVGNGYNDGAMFAVCALSIGVIGPEGAWGQLLKSCDVVVNSILDALDLLLKTDRLRATLRT